MASVTQETPVAASEDITKTANDDETSFTIELVTPEDRDAVLKHLQGSFFLDEPMNKFLNIGNSKEMVEYSFQSINEKCSFKAVNKKGEIIGVLMRAIARRPAPGTAISKKTPTACAKFNKILELIDYVDEHFNIFDTYPDIDVVIDGILMSVDRNYRGLGIAGRLTDRSKQYMRENNISVMKAFCTSAYSTRVYEKLGFYKAFTVKYADYKVNGVAELTPPHPHTAANLMVKKFDFDNEK